MTYTEASKTKKELVSWFNAKVEHIVGCDRKSTYIVTATSHPNSLFRLILNPKTGYFGTDTRQI